MKALRSEFNVEIHCICWDQNKMTPFIPHDIDGITFYKRSDFNTAGLKEFIDKKAPQIIFISGRMDKSYLTVAAYFKAKGISIISACDNQWFGTVKNRVAALFSKYIYHRYFTYFWVPGRRQFEFAKRVGYSNKYILGYSLCADTAFFNEAFRNKLQHNNYFPRTIVFVGRFAAEKGLDLLVDAFTEFKREIQSDWKLILVGAGPISISSTNDILIENFMSTEELGRASINWGVFCLPSLFEPWGVVLHEFAAAGMPIITSDAVGAADTFVIDKYNGLLFKAGSALALKLAFTELAKMSDTELWEMGKRSVELSNAITPLKSACTFMSVLNDAGRR
jgi:glycosyltransferase involved in cell wall biosynthesis